MRQYRHEIRVMRRYRDGILVMRRYGGAMQS